MIRSMTGFASKAITLDLDQENKTNVSIALKSLNSRFFDSTCKLPYPLSNYETEFIKIFKSQLHRGYIYFTIHVSSTAIFKDTIQPSLQAIKGYLDAAERVQSRFGVEGKLSINDIFSLPNVFISYEQGIDENTKKLIFDTTHELVAQLIEAQTKEGAELKKDILARITIMLQEIDAIEKGSAQVMEAQKKKVAEALQEFEMDESKFAEIHKSALYAALDKIDIHEEIVRFKSHLNNLQSELESSSVEKGKRLDFTLQELAREINTITAKCSDSSISSRAINVKVEIEKAREQAQNIV